MPNASSLRAHVPVARTCTVCVAVAACRVLVLPPCLCCRVMTMTVCVVRCCASCCCCGSRYRSFQRGELKHNWQVAERVSQEFAEKYPGKWHVIVGKQYGSFVTHEASSYVWRLVGWLVGCVAALLLTPPLHAAHTRTRVYVCDRMLYFSINGLIFLVFKHG